MSLILGLDPGGTTGFAVFDVQPGEPFKLLEHGQISNGSYGFARWWDERPDLHGARVVSETFEDDHRTEDPDITPLRIEGILDYVARDWIGQPNYCKASAPDEFMKRYGLWFKGQPHATDAARHVVHWAKSKRHVPTLRAWWPRRA